MTHEERLSNLDRDGLFNLIELAKKKKQALDDAEKGLYYVVSDEWMNLGFFRQDNLEGALKFLVEEARKEGINRRGDFFFASSIATLVR